MHGLSSPTPGQDRSMLRKLLWSALYGVTSAAAADRLDNIRRQLVMVGPQPFLNVVQEFPRILPRARQSVGRPAQGQ